MWAIRRASNPIRNQGCYILFNQTFYTNTEAHSNLEIGGQYSKKYQFRGACRPAEVISYGDLRLARSLAWSRNRSSQFGTMSRDMDADDGGEGGSSDLDLESTPESHKIKLLTTEDDNKLDFEGDIVEEDGGDVFENASGLPGTEADGEKEIAKKIHSSQLLKILAEANRYPPNKALDQWVAGGKALGPSEISYVVLNLRKRRWYGKALQFMEWVEANKHLDYGEREYASHLDLVAKVLGLQKAENYIKTIPESFRGELVYRTLLANCVLAVNAKKAEEVFNKIRDLGFPVSTFSFNQLILLYKRVDPKKIGDVLKMMEKEDAKPSLFTYRLLIDIKGQRYDISGMEEVIATMKAEGIEPDLFLQVIIAKHYAAAGKKEREKAEKMVRDMEGNAIAENRAAYNFLLPLYASLGKADDVERLWKVCERNPQLTECFAAIEAWGKLGKVEEAERVFEKMMKSWRKLSAKYYNVLLKVYANRGLLSKGKELAKRMSDDGCKIGPLTWDLLVKLYAEGGEVEKADSILQKATEGSQLKPLFDSYIHVLRKYADRGDIHNAEKMFHRLRQVGYVGRMKQYQLLLLAYVNAKVPAYGFRERMKADNIFPNSAALEQLRAVDAFKKTEISELLD